MHEDVVVDYMAPVYLLEVWQLRALRLIDMCYHMQDYDIWLYARAEVD